MRIAQITPGIIPIPPNGWGAVEKIIWEYTKVLRSLGHHVEILYADDVRPGEWDIVHVHMANLALMLKDRGIPYVFSHHDHHAYHFGQESPVYRQNLEAIRGSVLSFVHAKYLIPFFGSPPQLRYLGHGANLEDYKFSDRSEDVLRSQTKLLMMAHNGLIGDPLFDRKGFIPGVLACKKLGLPLTVVCPSKVNRDFFQTHSDLLEYESLSVHYDLDYETSLKLQNEHHIFLNPGILEAGHPNLTVTENICMGIPVVGAMEGDLPGQKRIEIADGKISPDLLADAIQEVVNSYGSYVLECKDQRNLLSWEVVVSRMLMDYTSFSGISQKRLLLEDYENTPVSCKPSERPGFYFWFKRNPFFYKSSAPESNSVSIVFKDAKTGSIKNYLCPGENRRNWVTVNDPPKTYIDWEIEVRDGIEILDSYKMDLRGQHVLIQKGQEEHTSEIVDEFITSTGCLPTLDPGVLCSAPHFVSKSTAIDQFYRILNTDQIKDFFIQKSKIPSRTLAISLTGTLGDTISLVPILNKFAEQRGQVIDVVCGFDYLFKDQFPNIRIISMPPNLDAYTELFCVNYKFDLPLQLGFATQLKIDKDDIPRPRVTRSGLDRPISQKYVCFSTHSTAQAKHWNNNNAWSKLCDMLKLEGLIPVCIDRHKTFGIEGHWNPIPENCLDQTGQDLSGMIRWIEHCDFFIGLSSGLSWVAHALGKRVAMISGVTSKDNEFSEDCLRIHRDDVCNSCFNSPEKYPFDKGDWLWCPVHKGTSRAFECTKRISAKQVMDRLLESGWINSSKK